ncbi:hypothetical protein Taro_046482 [Colocasia esculenta]|uniref:Uncharacterized protein n=1 Tax=Colocasia esculenta TaxID=4460 RepID=A0A843WYZ2_COLES|nr:hypothetical protein [Colocasia esculenta]
MVLRARGARAEVVSPRSCRGRARGAWSEEEVAILTRRPQRVGYTCGGRDGLGCRDKVATAWAAATVSRQGWASRHGRDLSRDRLRSYEVPYFCGVFTVSASYCSRGTSASFLVRSYTSRSPGARHLRACPVREVVTVAWDPHPRAP